MKIRLSCDKENLPRIISTGSFTNMFHKSASPVFTVHNIKMRTAGWIGIAFEPPYLWPHKRHTFCYYISLSCLYTILTDMKKLFMNFSESVLNRRHHTFRYSPRNRTVDIYGTLRYNMQRCEREGEPLPQETDFN
jgi:hypothetical protein